MQVTFAKRNGQKNVERFHAFRTCCVPARRNTKGSETGGVVTGRRPDVRSYVGVATPWDEPVHRSEKIIRERAKLN